MEMAIALCFFFVVTTAVFVAVAIFLPEWVGINGEKSAQVRREQQGDLPDLEQASEQIKQDAKD